MIFALDRLSGAGKVFNPSMPPCRSFSQNKVAALVHLEERQNLKSSESCILRKDDLTLRIRRVHAYVQLVHHMIVYIDPNLAL